MAFPSTPLYEVAPNAAFDVRRVRADFPILRRSVHGRPLVYLDNAATTQKPQVVLDALTRYYTDQNANVHRGVHLLSEIATEAFDTARTKVRTFLNAASDREIVFTRNATESINLVANAYVRPRLQPGDEVLISAMEHHSNIVPWQLVCQERGARLRVAPIDDRGALIFEEFTKRLTERTRIVAVSHMSNALGTINPIPEIVAAAHDAGIPVLVDGSQAAYHMPVDVQALGVDFYAATGHKLYGPTGIGVLYGREALLEAMPPFLGGGDMIASVSFEKSTWNELPFKFEAGTPHIEGSAPRSTTSSPSAWRRSAHTSGSCSSTAPRSCRASPASVSSAPRRTRRASSRSSWRRPTRTTSARSWTARAWPSAPGITVRSR